MIQRPQMFNPVGPNDYVQVIHMAAARHWISVTNILGKGQVRLFDSLGLAVPHEVKQAIASKLAFKWIH